MSRSGCILRASCVSRAAAGIDGVRRQAVHRGPLIDGEFGWDVIDMRTYRKLPLPVLGLGSTGYFWSQASVTPGVAPDCKLVTVEYSGSFFAEEPPDFVAGALTDFFK
jgi:hypothetical protein